MRKLIVLTCLLGLRAFATEASEVYEVVKIGVTLPQQVKVLLKGGCQPTAIDPDATEGCEKEVKMHVPMSSMNVLYPLFFSAVGKGKVVVLKKDPQGKTTVELLSAPFIK